MRKSPERSPAFLAADRANGRKSTGPRTVEGKAQMRLNALKHGSRSASFTEFIRSLGLPPRLIHQLCTKTRLPIERIGIMQMSLLRRWLARTWGPTSPRFHKFLRGVSELERLAADRALRQTLLDRLEAEGVARFHDEFLTLWDRARKEGVQPMQPPE